MSISTAEQYQPCLILETFHRDGNLAALDRNYFLKPLSDFNLNRLEYILKEFQKNCEWGVATLLTWRPIVEFTLKSITPNIKKSSWKRYKIALNAVFNTAMEKDLAPATFLRNLLAEISITQVDCLVAEKAEKSKRIRVEEIYMLRLAAYDADEKLSVDWLEFNTLTNLRPNELEYAQLVFTANNEPLLTALNTIKSDATKKNIETGVMDSERNIDLTHLSFHDLTMIERFLIKTRACIETDGYSAFYEKMRSKLRHLSTNCIGRSISLSVGRTQYAANHKSLNPGENEELASLMGHSDPTRPQRSYGKRSYGYAKLAIKPSEEAHISERPIHEQDE
ncbi:MAG: hypothetical protein GW890_02510 [Vibrio sp.]|nr:hypothetical protein [Vibrio sp.]